MVKKLKEEEKPAGCICPIQNGCRVKQTINPDNLGDAVKVVCSNGDKCKQILYVHSACYDLWCESLLKDYKALGNRARNDARMERYYAVNNDHIWGSNAYGKLSRFCKCPCGGILKKCLEIDPTKEKPAVPPPPAQAKKPKKTTLPPLVTNKKYKGPGKMCNGPTGSYAARNPVMMGDRRMSENDSCYSADSADPYIPPGLYAAGGDRKAHVLRNVDISVNVIEQPPKPKPTVREKRSAAARSSNLDQLNTEDELLAELNELFDRIPDDLNRDELTELVNTVLSRADVAVLSTIADVGGVWEWLRNKADESEDCSVDEEFGDGERGEKVIAEAKVPTQEASADEDQWYSSVEEPSAAAVASRMETTTTFIADEIKPGIGFSAAFVYRESVDRVEALVKKMNNNNKM